MNELFFVVSKVAWAILSPSNLIVLLMSLAALLLLMNKVSAAKWILVPTMLASFSLLAYPISDLLMEPLESQISKPEVLPEQVDGIIVLGGGEELKQSISWQTAEMGNGGDRYIAAAILAKYYPDVPVIFTGGSGLLRLQDSGKEASIATELLTSVGISENRLILESKSRNTHENFLFMKPKLPKRYGRYMLVTSAFHMPRSVGIAQKQGIDVIPYPVDFRSNTPALRQWDFNLFDHLEVLEPAWREWIGLTVYYWTGKTSAWLPQSTSE